MVTAYADGHNRPALRPPHDPRGNPSKKPRQHEFGQSGIFHTTIRTSDTYTAVVAAVATTAAAVAATAVAAIAAVVVVVDVVVAAAVAAAAVVVACQVNEKACVVSECALPSA